MDVVTFTIFIALYSSSFFFFCTSENPWSPIVGHFCGPFYPHLLLIHGVYHSILMRICQPRVLFRFSYFIRNNKRVFMALLLPRQKTRVIKQEPDSIETHYTILRTTIAPWLHSLKTEPVPFLSWRFLLSKTIYCLMKSIYL